MIMSNSKIKYIVSHLAVIMMIFTCFAGIGVAGAAPASAMQKVCKVTGSTLFVRKDAGTKYAKVGSLKKGTYRLVLGSKEGTDGKTWYKVSVKNKTGYICSQYTSTVKVSVKKMNTTGTVKVSSGSLFARSGPGTIYNTVGKFAKGKKIKITGKAKDINGTYWYKTSVSKTTAYVSSKYVSIGTTATKATTKATTKAKTKSTTKATTKATTTKKSSSTTKASTTTKATTTKATTTKATTISFKVTSVKNLAGKVNVSSGSLYVRSGPSTSHSILGTLKKGKTFTVTGKTKVDGVTWYRLTHKKKTGYVHGKYVKTMATSSSSTTTSGTTTATTTKKSSSSTTTTTLTSDDLAKKTDHYSKTLKARKAAVNWAIKIANDNSFHYGKSKWAHHNGCYFCGTNQAKNSIKRRSGGSKSEVLKTYCCNPFVTAAYCHGAGAPEMDCKESSKRVGLANDTNKVFRTKAWQKVAKPSKMTQLKVGDILLTPTHAMLYIGDSKVAHAAHHDNGKKGAYWNDSIKVGKLSSSQWKRTSKIYRYLGTGKY